MEILQPALSINAELLNKGRNTLRAINHSLRQQMIQLIHQHGKITVTEIYCKLDIEQPVASQHLAILRKEKFVNTMRDGQRIFYSVSYERIKEVEGLCRKLNNK